MKYRFPGRIRMMTVQSSSPSVFVHVATPVLLTDPVSQYTGGPVGWAES